MPPDPAADPIASADEQATAPDAPDDLLGGAAESQPRSVSVLRAVAAVVACLLLAMLLVSEKLVEIAERQPFGSERDRWLGLAQDVDRVANFLSLNRPYDFVRDLREGDEEAGQRFSSIEEFAAAASLPTAVEASGTPTGSAAVPFPLPSDGSNTATNRPTLGTAGTGGDMSETDTAAADSLLPGMFVVPYFVPREPWPVIPTGPPPPFPILAACQPDTPRPRSDTTPLETFVAGDSQAFYPGQSLADDFDDGLLNVTIDSRNSTGLARPDFFNWPAQLCEVAKQENPDLVVLFLGSNDWQDLRSEQDERYLVRGSEGWQEEMGARLRVLLSTVWAEHRHVVWVTLPPPRNESWHRGFAIMNEVAAEVIGDARGVTLVDIWELFGGDKPYTERLARTEGQQTVRVRQGDGVHLTRTGSRWVAELVREVAIREWDLPQE